MPPYRELYRPPSSRAASQPRMLHVTPASPEYEADYFLGDLGDPATEPSAWSPLGWVASQASAAADTLKRAGQGIIDQVVSEAQDLGATLWAAATGEPGAGAGVIFDWTTGLAESVNKLLPETVKRKLGTSDQSNVAGYITLADGTQIPVPKAEDAQGQGEKALSDSFKAALTKANASAASDRMKMQLETQKQKITADQWAKQFALTERSAEQAARMNELAVKAAELAYDRQRYSAAQLALWGIASTASGLGETKHRAVQAIGPGLAGAPIQIYKGPMYGRMVGD